MAKIPKGAAIEVTTSKIPAGAVFEPESDEAYGPNLDENSLAAAIRRNNAQQAEATPKTIPGTEHSLYDEVVPNAAEVGQKIRSGLMGVTSNVAPRVLAGMDALGAGVKGSTYAESLPKWQKQYSDAAAAQPGSNILGSMLQPNPLGKVKAVSTLGKVGLAAARVGQAGAQGGLAGYMGADLNPTAQDQGLKGGMAGGAGVQGALELASPVAGKLAGYFHDAAGSQAIKAAGFRTGISNPAKRAGIPIFDAAGEEALPKLGNEMLDEGLIPFGGSKADVLKRANEKMGSAGAAQRDAIAAMDAEGGANANAAARMAQRRLNERIDPALGGNLQTARAAGPATSLIDDIVATGKREPTFQALQDLKSGGYGSTNWTQHPPDAMALKRQANSGLKEYLEQSADRAGVGDRLRGANKTYGLAAKTADLAEEAAGREKGYSPLNWVAAGAAGAAGGVHSPLAGGLAGLGTMAATHLLKDRRSAAAAHALRFGSKVAAGAEQAVNQSPAAAAGIEQWLQKRPDDQREEEGANYFTSSTGGR